MSIALCVTTFKGGVGKTMTAFNLAAAIARKTKNKQRLRVLLIDADSQGNLTNLFFPRRQCYDFPRTMLSMFEKDEKASNCISVTNVAGIDIIPYHELIEYYFQKKFTVGSIFEKVYRSITPGEKIDRAKLGEFFDNIVKEEQLLTKILRNKLQEPVIQDLYDFIIIDTKPASLSLLVYGCLTAADHYLVPIEAGSLWALKGLEILHENINSLVNSGSLNIGFLGAVLTKYDKRVNACEVISQNSKEIYNGKMFESVISTSTAVAECAFHGKTIYEFAKNSQASRDFTSLSYEVLNRLGVEYDKRAE